MRALLAFFTVLPMAAPVPSLEEAARKAYLLPFVGLLVGLPGAALLLVASTIPAGVAATLALGATLRSAGRSKLFFPAFRSLAKKGEPERCCAGLRARLTAPDLAATWTGRASFGPRHARGDGPFRYHAREEGLRRHKRRHRRRHRRAC